MASSSLVEINPTAGVASTPSSARPWSDLTSDLLVSIFSRLSSIDKIVGVSSVCSSWRAAAKDPHCWRILDLSDWETITARIPVPVTFNQVLNCLLRFVRESELVEKLDCPLVANGEDLILVTDRLPNLLYLSFPVVLAPVHRVFPSLVKFKCLKGISVSPSFFLSSAFALLGTNFLDLTELKLLGRENPSGNYLFVVLVICECLPKLKKLEIPCSGICTVATLMLLDSLEHLEYLDISGCNSSGITKEIIEKASRLKVFIWKSNEESVGATCSCLRDEMVLQRMTDLGFLKNEN